MCFSFSLLHLMLYTWVQGTANQKSACRQKLRNCMSKQGVHTLFDLSTLGKVFVRLAVPKVL